MSRGRAERVDMGEQAIELGGVRIEVMRHTWRIDIAHPTYRCGLLPCHLAAGTARAGGSNSDQRPACSAYENAAHCAGARRTSRREVSVIYGVRIADARRIPIRTVCATPIRTFGEVLAEAVSSRERLLALGVFQEVSTGL